MSDDSSPPVPVDARADDSDNEETAGTSAGGAKTLKHHYAWNEKTAQRKAELEALGAHKGPVALDASSPLPVPEVSPAAHGAVWNAAQTFVTKDISKKVGPAMKDTLCGKVLKVKGATASHLAVRISAVPKCEGEASLAFSRGKARPGFELAVELSFEVIPADSAGLGEGAAVVSAGTIKIEELADHDSDLFGGWSVVVKADDHNDGACGGVTRDALRGAIKTSAFADDLRSLLREHWIEALKKL